MKVLVTGATGFVGRVLVPHLLAAGHEVRAASRSAQLATRTGLEVVSHPDLAEAFDWHGLVDGVDAVVHLAGIAHTRGVTDAGYDAVNHQATARLAAAAAAGSARLVFVSSIKAQSGAASSHVLSESDDPRPEDAYGRSKLAAERAVQRAGGAHTILRPVLVHGPGVKGNLRSLVRLASIPAPLPLGSFTAPRSLVAVSDLCRAVEIALSSPATLDRVFVVAHPVPTSLAELVTAMRAAMGRPAHLLPAPVGLLERGLRLADRGDVWDRVGGAMVVDPSRLLAAGWQPRVDVAQGMGELVRAAALR